MPQRRLPGAPSPTVVWIKTELSDTEWRVVGLRVPVPPWYTVAELHHDVLGRRGRRGFSDAMTTWTRYCLYDGQTWWLNRPPPPDRCYVHGPTYIDEHFLVHDVAADNAG